MAEAKVEVVKVAEVKAEAREVKIDIKTEQVEVEAKREQRQPTPKSKLKPLLSFSSLMAGEIPSQESSSTPAVQEVEESLDSDYVEKLTLAREAILSFIARWRPRFVATFESMTFEREGICIAVPTTELEQEILRAKTELLTKVVEIAKIRGKIELNIEINEAIRASRPIRLEDRVAHIIKANPLIDKLRSELDLTIE
ncbi:MAG: DNA polymerase III subunit gamma/tau [Rikenellaceae bacterium]